MKRLILILLISAVFAFAACSAPVNAGETPIAPASQSQDNTPDLEPNTATENSGEDGSGNYNKYTDYEPSAAQPTDLIKGTDPSILVAYFSRSGNTDISGDVDAVSSASLTVNSDGTTTGNTQLIAQWIAEQTGGDLFLIQTEYTYPLDYDRTVAVGEGQDDDNYFPVIISHLGDISGYDYIFLVYPVWHYSMSIPTRSFLQDYDFAGKTIFAYDVNAGSGFADTLQVIEEFQPGATVVEGLAINQNDVPGSESEVRESAAALLSEYGNAASDGDDDMNNNQNENANPVTISINGENFKVNLEDNDTAREFAQMFADSPLTLELSDYGGFEKVGSLGRALTADNTNMTTEPGDIVLYNGSNIVIFYGSNTWDYTKIGSVEDADGLKDALGEEDVTVVFE